MPIREEAFKMGCRRYIQGEDYIYRIGEEVNRLGSAPLFIGDDTTLPLTEEKIRKSVNGVCKKYEFYTYNGTCNDVDAKIVAEYALSKGMDVIVGVGGGVLMDFAKVCAFYAQCPVINIPTSSATCAAYASIAVRYTQEGRTVGSLHLKQEVDAVIADTRILAQQPIRLLLAGVFDALAKHLEIKQRFNADDPGEFPIGLDYASVLSEHTFDVLSKKTAGCIAAMQRDEINFDVENVIFAAIAATGNISGIARGSNQCALAHKFYETARTLFPEESKPYLHGEIVGVGLLLQNHFNNEVEKNEFLLDLMHQYNMPCTVDAVGVVKDEATMQAFYDKICGSSAVDKDNEVECRKFKEGLAYLWSL